jgi:hypothetical protein
MGYFAGGRHIKYVSWVIIFSWQWTLVVWDVSSINDMVATFYLAVNFDAIL